jgi:hypothetical protein
VPINVLVLIALPLLADVVSGASVFETVEALPLTSADVLIGPSVVGSVEVASDFSVVLLDPSTGWLIEVGSSFVPVNILVLITLPPSADVVSGSSVVETVEVASDFSVVLLDPSTGWLIEVGSSFVPVNILVLIALPPSADVVSGSSVVETVEVASDFSVVLLDSS